jgi:uncharacterized protein (TIGR03067 family)
MRPLIVLNLIFVVTATINIDQGESKDEDNGTILGTWLCVRVEGLGKPPPERGTLTFDKDTVTATIGKMVRFRGTYKLDSSKNPKTIDIDVTESSEDGEKEKRMLGIYAIDGDTLKWSTALPGEKSRPKGFKDIWFTYKKDKDRR